MIAAMLRAFGPPQNLVAEELPDAVARPGQVLVDVELASVTFVETQLRAGRPPHPAMAPELPVVLGNGVGGVAGGRRVVTTTGGRGGYAQRAAVDPGLLIELPAELSLADAVALLADGRTALSQIDIVAIEPGETVLVLAAAGGVGSLLVQLATGAGARVVAAAGGQAKAELALALGAAAAVDYLQPDWTDGVGAVDVVFDGVGGAIARSAFELVRTGGRFSSFGMASGSFAGISDEAGAGVGVTPLRGSRLGPAELRALSVRALEAAAAGAISPVVGQTFALEDAARAHAAIEARETTGKTLLRA